jgi:hypothetical protein
MDEKNRTGGNTLFHLFAERKTESLLFLKNGIAGDDAIFPSSCL